MADDALMQPESRAAYRRLLNAGWTDALGVLNPRGGVWTYWDYQAGAWQRDHGFRIDHATVNSTSSSYTCTPMRSSCPWARPSSRSSQLASTP